jgi:hypothetical protein
MKKRRMTGAKYWKRIKDAKNTHDLKWSQIAEWMGISAGNLRSMISHELNPTRQEWRFYLAGLNAHLGATMTTMFPVPLDRIAYCQYSGLPFLKLSHNAKFHPDYRKRSSRKIKHEE